MNLLVDSYPVRMATQYGVLILQRYVVLAGIERDKRVLYRSKYRYVGWLVGSGSRLTLVSARLFMIYD